MAMKIDAGDTAVRGSNTHKVDYTQIVVDYGDDCRMDRPSKEAVESLAEQILLPPGQLQPVQCRRIAGNKLRLIFGFTRYEAIKYINEVLGTPLQIRVEVIECNEEEALTIGISSNFHNDPTPMDHAFNHRKLRDRLNWTDAQIAKFYGKTPAWVSSLTVLLRLPKRLQQLIAKGQLSYALAPRLVDLSTAEQDAIIIDCMEPTEDGSGKIKTQKVNDKIRDMINEKVESNETTDSTPVASTETSAQETPSDTPAKPPKSTPAQAPASTGTPPRTMSQLRKYFQEMKEAEDRDEAEVDFATSILKFFNGGGEKAFNNALDRFRDTKKGK